MQANTANAAPLQPATVRTVLLGRLVSSAAWFACSYLLFIAIWSAASAGMGNPILLPSPKEVLLGFRDLLQNGSLLIDIFASLRRVFVGFFFAAVFAVPLAIVLAYFPTPRRLTLPIINLLRPIPPIAWIPLSILWFGIGNAPSYFITAVAAFLPVFVNAYAGGLAVEERHIHAAQFMGARRAAIIARILLPSALPYIWTGLKIGLGQSWMAVVAAELIVAQSGLGYMIQINRINLDTSYVLVGMVTIGILGSSMTAVLDYVERYVIPWKEASS
jgi:ABC-type nitrate/sulfonate/bicarbonate transport system permease component